MSEIKRETLFVSNNNNSGISNELIAHDLAVAIVINRHIDTPAQAVEEYQTMYKDILHRITK